MRHEVRHLTSGREEVHPSPGIGEDGARRQVIRHVGMRGGESRFFRSGGSVNKILGGRHGRDSHCLRRVGDGSSLRVHRFDGRRSCRSFPCSWQSSLRVCSIRSWTPRGSCMRTDGISMNCVLSSTFVSVFFAKATSAMPRAQPKALRCRSRETFPPVSIVVRRSRQLFCRRRRTRRSIRSWVFRERQLPTDTMRAAERELCSTHPRHRGGRLSFWITDVSLPLGLERFHLRVDSGE